MYRILLLLLLTLNLSAKCPTTPLCKDFIAGFEGVRYTPYQLNGIWHSGIGHVLMPGEYKYSYTEDDINGWFERDLAKAYKSVNHLCPTFDNQPEEIQLVLLSLAYNLGNKGLSHFPKFLAALDNCDYSGCAAELRNSRWYRQVGRRGEHHVSVFESF